MKYIKLTQRSENSEMELEEPIANSLSESQIFQLKNQVMAYKYLIRNMPMPTEIEQNLLHLSPEQWEIERENLFMRSMRYYNEKIEKKDEMKEFILERTGKKTSEGLNISSEVLLNENAIKFVAEKSEFFLERRLNEVNNLLTSSMISESAKTNLKIEKLMIENRDFYFKMRDILLSNFKKVSNNNRVLEKQMLDRNFFKREKPSRRAEAKMVERIELQMRHEQEQRKKVRQKEFINALLLHQSEFLEFHKKKMRNAKKRAMHAKTYLEFAEKRGFLE